VKVENSSCKINEEMSEEVEGKKLPGQAIHVIYFMKANQEVHGFSRRCPSQLKGQKGEPPFIISPI
jgi:hypothetical protein